MSYRALDSLITNRSVGGERFSALQRANAAPSSVRVLSLAVALPAFARCRKRDELRLRRNSSLSYAQLVILGVAGAVFRKPYVAWALQTDPFPDMRSPAG